MANKLHLDFETRSRSDIRKEGAARYAMDPSTQILIACWCIERDGKRGPVETWRIGQPKPQALIDAVNEPGMTVVAHNAMFELFVWNYVGQRMGWGTLRIDQMDCTMARAYVMSLPGALANVTRILGVKAQKNPDGKDGIKIFSIPNPDGSFNEPDDYPEDFRRFCVYCADDVRAECGLDDVLPQLSASERAIYHFDLLVNSRGFRLDVPVMEKAAELLDAAKAQADARLREVTGIETYRTKSMKKGTTAPFTTTTTGPLKEWIKGRGIPADGLAKDDVAAIREHAELIGDDAVLEALRLRQLGSKATSLAKYRSGLACASPKDQRARGLLNYHKASTGRWAGALYQPHNLERVDHERDWPQVEQMLEWFNRHDAPDIMDLCELNGIEPLQALGKCTRAMIVAAPGKRLIGADFSNVEGRGSAWLAGEEWKLEAFRQYDAGTGPDLYKLAYAKSFGVAVDGVTKPQRQIGKVEELAFGYQGAVGALVKMAAGYGLDPDTIMHAVLPAAEPKLLAACRAKYDPKSAHGLSIDQFTALRYLVDSWRQAHPMTVKAWYACQEAVIEAVSNPGQRFSLFNNRVVVRCTRNRAFLYIYLPSGRPLAYFRPKIREEEVERDDGSTWIKRSVTVEGVDSRGGANAWGKVYLYGGIIWENIIQALCRDLLAHGMMAAEAAGYPICLHVHDEAVAEVPFGTGSAEEFQTVLSAKPKWAAGFPLVSAGWEDERYVK